MCAINELVRKLGLSLWLASRRMLREKNLIKMRSCEAATKYINLDNVYS